MPVITSSGYDIEIQALSGEWIPLMLQVRTDEQGNTLAKTLQEVLAAANSDAPISDELEAIVQESWSRGVGLDYDWAPGVDTRDAFYVCPAGAASAVTLPAGTSTGISAIEEFEGSLYVAQIGDGTANSARVVKIDGVTEALTVSLLIAGAGEYMRGLVTADNGGGTTCLYAMSSDAGSQNGRVHRLSGGAWISTAAAFFGTNGRSVATRVVWRGRDGIKNNTIVTKSGPKKISYTKPNSDPMTPATNWVEGVPIGTAYEIIRIASSRGHIFISAKDGLFDLDEVGNSPNLLAWASQNSAAGNGDACQYLDGNVFYSTGYGLDMVNVEQGEVLQEQRGRCEPGAFLPVDQCPRASIVAMCVDQGWLVAASGPAYIPGFTGRHAAIWWGRSANQLRVESPNPMVWHGPLLLLGNNQRVTQMRVWTGAGGLRLWVASVEDATGVPQLVKLSIPLTGSTLYDQATSGPHRVTQAPVGGNVQPVSRIYGLPNTVRDKAARKDLHQIVVGSRGLSVTDGSQVTLYTRADPLPGSTTWGAGQTLSTGPIATIAAPSVTKGYALQYRVDFTAAGGGMAPPLIPYLTSLRTTYWRLVPATDAWTLPVMYGDGVLNLANGIDESRSPDQITALLQGVLGERTVIRDRQDRRRNVRMRQFFSRDITFGELGSYGKIVVATLRLDDLGPAS